MARFSKASSKKKKLINKEYAQAESDVKWQGDNTATTLEHGQPLKDPNEIMRSYVRRRTYRQKQVPWK